MPGPIARAVAQEAARLAARDPASLSYGQQFPRDAGWVRMGQSLALGEDLRVILDDGASVRGTFHAADDESVTLLVAGYDRQLMRARVRRLAVARGTHRRRNTYIGLAIGLVAGLVNGNRYCREERALCQEDAIPHIYPLIGAGVAIGALFPAGTAWRELYARAQP